MVREGALDPVRQGGQGGGIRPCEAGCMVREGALDPVRQGGKLGNIPYSGYISRV